MNTFISQLNAAGEFFVQFALPMMIQVSLLVVIILAMDVLLRRKVRAAVRYSLWMLVLVKLVLPASLAAPTGIGYWIGGEFLVPHPAGLSQPIIVKTEPVRIEAVPPAPVKPLIDAPQVALAPAAPAAEPESVTAATAATVATAAPAVSLTWQSLVLIGWAVVAAALLLLLVQRAFFVRGLIATAGPASESLLAALESYRVRLGCRFPVMLKLSHFAGSPAVCGLFRPIILIPAQLASALDERQLEAVLLHELAHVKRGDLWVNCVQALLQIAYFYNPLVWLANAVIRRLREQAVDEAVLVAMGKPAEEYSSALVDVARLSLRGPALSLRLVGVVESKKALAHRIRHILSRPVPKSVRLGVAGTALVLVAAALLLPMAKGQPAAPTAQLAHSQPATRPASGPQQNLLASPPLSRLYIKVQSPPMDLKVYGGPAATTLPEGVINAEVIQRYVESQSKVITQDTVIDQSLKAIEQTEWYQRHSRPGMNIRDELRRAIRVTAVPRWSLIEVAATDPAEQDAGAIVKAFVEAAVDFSAAPTRRNSSEMVQRLEQERSQLARRSNDPQTSGSQREDLQKSIQFLDEKIRERRLVLDSFEAIGPLRIVELYVSQSGTQAIAGSASPSSWSSRPVTLSATNGHLLMTVLDAGGGAASLTVEGVTYCSPDGLVYLAGARDGKIEILLAAPSGQKSTILAEKLVIGPDGKISQPDTATQPATQPAAQ